MHNSTKKGYFSDDMLKEMYIFPDKAKDPSLRDGKYSRYKMRKVTHHGPSKATLSQYTA